MVTLPNNDSVDFNMVSHQLKWRQIEMSGFFPGTDKNASVFHSSQLHRVILVSLQREAVTNMQWSVWWLKKRTLILKKPSLAKTSSASVQPVRPARDQPSSQRCFSLAGPKKCSKHRNRFCHHSKHSENIYTQWRVLHPITWNGKNQKVGWFEISDGIHPSMLLTNIWIFIGL